MLLLSGCQSTQRDTPVMQFHAGQYSRALTGIVAWLDKEPTQDKARAFLDQHGVTLWQAVITQLDTQQSLITDYLTSCAQLLPAMTTLAAYDSITYQSNHINTCVTMRQDAVAQWITQSQLANDRQDYRTAIMYYDMIETYDTLTPDLIAHRQILIDNLTQTVGLRVILTDETGRFSQDTLTHDLLALLADTAYYNWRPETSQLLDQVDHMINVKLRITATDSLSEATWETDTLWYTVKMGTQTHWYEREFQYPVYDRYYALSATGTISHLASQSDQSNTDSLRLVATQTMTYASPTLDYPANYQQIRLPATYQLKLTDNQLDQAAIDTVLIQKLANKLRNWVSSLPKKN